MKLTIQRKLFIFSIILGVITFVIFAAIYINNQSKTYQNEILAANEREIAQFTERLNQELSNVSTVSNYIYLDKDFQSHLSRYHEEKNNKTVAESLIINDLKKYTPLWRTLFPKSFIITSDDRIIGNFIYEDYFKQSVKEPQNWYNYSQNTLYGAWHTFEANDNNTPYVFYVRSLKHNSSNEKADLLVLCFSANEIYKLMSGSKGNYRSIFLLDESDRIITYDDQNNIGENLSFFSDEYRNQFSGSYGYKKEGSVNQIIFRSIPYPSWKVIVVSNTNQQISALNKNGSVYIAVAMLYLTVLFAVSYIASKSITRPINNLYAKMTKARDGDLTVRADVVSNDEIGMLTEHFNNMLDAVQLLMAKVIEEQELKNEADKKALQSQINPHFLYNTLANVRYYILTGERTLADGMILSLTKLLKNILSNTNELVSISMEMDQLNDYIAIQKHMLENELKVVINVEPEVFDYMIIKLILQPVVENALLHGLKDTENPKLTINAGFTDDNIYIDINDNGKGFNNVEDFQRRLDTVQSGQSIGLFNVNNRLKLHFGNTCGITIKSIVGEGTTVRVIIPKILYRKESSAYEYINSRR